MAKRVTSVAIDRAALRLIDKAAAVEDRSRSQFIQRAGLKAAKEALDLPPEPPARSDGEVDE